MKDLKTILTEGFFKNVGAEVPIANIITHKKLSRKIYETDTRGERTSSRALISRTGMTSIHVNVLTDFYKKDFDVDYSKYSSEIYNLVDGNFSELDCIWITNTVPDDAFILCFFDKKQRWKTYYIFYHPIANTIYGRERLYVPFS